jgi:hypothetical protein
LIGDGALSGAIGEGIVFDGEVNCSFFHVLDVFPADDSFFLIPFSGETNPC